MGHRHQWQTSGEHHELASLHGGGSFRGGLLIAADLPMMPRFVTSGTARGTSGGVARTTGRLSSSSSIDRRPTAR
jgi:hypothetical protein